MLAFRNQNLFGVIFGVVLILQTTGVHGQEPDTGCLSLPTCEKCLTSNATEYSCTWCSSSMKCLNSTNIEASCSAWTSTCNVEVKCEEQQSCADCLNTDSCGWCDNHACLPGNASDPYDPNANCQQWTFGKNPDQICGVICSSFIDCFSCTTQLGCGWCNNTQCLQGNQYQPINNYCNKWDFNITGSVCEGETLDCGKHETCGNCTSDESERCGWCKSTETCLEYDPNEDPPVCEIWLEKTCNPCDSLKDCESCSSDSDCGWCNQTSCVRGGSLGPATHICEEWGYYQCPFDCSYYTTCDSCSSYLDCGWCQGSNGYSKCLNNATVCEGSWISECSPNVFSCSNVLTCDECIAYSGCTWCGDTGCQTWPGDNDCKLKCSSGMSPTKVAMAVTFSVLGTVLVAFGFTAWYRLYWRKRHYYETLR
eukprot:TRINITY_DN7014_c0_g1_i1.p1 TRINITY_DN7014_c0_g1~~TRINITY_DN7014_c0_g1_i1.p1  ORF type:complete len:423 (+),score=10.60 TRINITY_DN7014_c0_g1_i1:117-1385(+)